MTTIRKASINDLEPLAELFDAYRVFYKQSSNLKSGKAFLEERILKNESEIFLSLNLDSVLTGFVQLYPIFSSTRMQRLWLLNDLFVNQKYRGQGISKLLLGKAQEMSKLSGACGIILETAKSNEIANKLYINTGFTLDAEHNYYSC